MIYFFAVLLQKAAGEGPQLGPFSLLPQSIGSWLAIIMAGIALWAHIKQRAAKSVDLDGLGARVGRMESALAELRGKVDALASVQSNFISTQTSQSERVGSVQRAVEECDTETRELKQAAMNRLDRIREDQQVYATRLTRMEERMKITPP